MAERRAEAIDRNAKLYRVDPHWCGCCGQPGDDLFVITDAANANYTVCFACINWTGSGLLLRRASHLNHERDRLMARISRRDRRR